MNILIRSTILTIVILVNVWSAQSYSQNSSIKRSPVYNIEYSKIDIVLSSTKYENFNYIFKTRPNFKTDIFVYEETLRIEKDSILLETPFSISAWHSYSEDIFQFDINELSADLNPKKDVRRGKYFVKHENNKYEIILGESSAEIKYISNSKWPKGNVKNSLKLVEREIRDSANGYVKLFDRTVTMPSNDKPIESELGNPPDFANSWHTYYEESSLIKSNGIIVKRKVLTFYRRLCREARGQSDRTICESTQDSDRKYVTREKYILKKNGGISPMPDLPHPGARGN